MIDQTQEFNLPFPSVQLNIYPHTTATSVPPHPNSNGNVPSEIIQLDAAVLDTDSQADELTYLPNTQSLKLANNCDWTVEFRSSFADFKLEGLELPDGTKTPDQLCSSSVRLKDHNGQMLGNPLVGAPNPADGSIVGGGAFILEASSSGLTYNGSLVSSIEFLGCLELEYYNSSMIQIFDDAAPAGDFSYTISAAEDGNGETTCEGFAPPASQSQADGLALTGVLGVYSHYLNHSCDWVVTFTNTNECEAIAVWNFTEGGSLEYLDSVLADPANPGTMSVRLHQHVDGGFVYFLGSGTTTLGGLRYASDGAGVNSAGPTPEAAADPEAMVAVNALSLECVSDIEFASISGLEGPTLDIRAESQTVPQVGDVTGASTCHTTQSRLPDASTIRAAESFRLPLNVKCSWDLEFKSTVCGTRLHAKVFDNASPPVQIGDTLEGDDSDFETIALASSLNGLTYTPTNGNATAVGAIRFYGCFHPTVSVDVPGTAVGDELAVTITRVGSDADCMVTTKTTTRTRGQGGGEDTYTTTTAAADTATLTLELRSGERVNLSNASGTTLSEYLANLPRIKLPADVTQIVTELANLASDGTLCRYKATVTGPARLGALTTTNLISGAHGYLTVIQPREVVPLTFTNLTADKGAVEVTTTPQAVCPQAAPSASPYTVAASASVTAMLGYQDCVWTIAYANDNECDVSAQLKDADGTAVQFKDADGMDAGLTDSDGEFLITTHSRTGDSTPVSSVEFTVADTNCASQTTTATVAVAVTINDALNADFMGASFDIEFTKLSGPATGCQVGGMDVGTGVGNGHTETVAITSGRTRTVNVTVVDVPDGETTHCAYFVHFPASATHNGITLNRTAPGSSGQVSVAPQDRVRRPLPPQAATPRCVRLPPSRRWRSRARPIPAPEPMTGATP